MRRTTDVMKTGSLRILIVDDEPAHIDAICRSLEDMDEVADVVMAGTLAQYRQAIAGHLPDIVLDEDLKRIPTVILTTSATEADMACAYAKGAGSYLVKPVNFKKFTQMMHAFGFYWLAWNRFPE